MSPIFLCILLSSLCLSIAGCADCLALLARHSAKPSSLLTVHHPLTDYVSSDINSPDISCLFSQLIYDGEHLDLTHFVYAHYLSGFCRMRGFLILLEKRSARPSSLLMFITLADNISGDVNSPGITYFQSSSLMVNIYISPSLLMPMHYYLLSFCLLQNERTVSRSWQCVQQSQSLR